MSAFNRYKRYAWVLLLLTGCQRGCNYNTDKVLGAKEFPVQIDQTPATLQVQKVEHKTTNSKWNGRIGLGCSCSQTEVARDLDYSYGLQLPNRPFLSDICSRSVYSAPDTSYLTASKYLKFNWYHNKEHLAVTTADSGLLLRVYHLLPQGGMPFLSEHIYTANRYSEHKIYAKDFDASVLGKPEAIAWKILKANTSISGYDVAKGHTNTYDHLFIKALQDQKAPSPYDFFILENMKTHERFFDVLSEERVAEAAKNSAEWKAKAMKMATQCIRDNEKSSNAIQIVFGMDNAALYETIDHIYEQQWFDTRHGEAVGYFSRRKTQEKHPLAASTRTRLKARTIKMLYSNDYYQKDAFAYLIDEDDKKAIHEYFEKCMTIKDQKSATVELAEAHRNNLEPQTKKLIIERAKILLTQENTPYRKQLLTILAGNVNCSEWANYRKLYNNDLNHMVLMDTCR
jgi:hypothetical protein